MVITGTHVELFPDQVFALGGTAPRSITRSCFIAQVGLLRVSVVGAAVSDDGNRVLTPATARMGLRGDTGATGTVGGGSVHNPNRDGNGPGQTRGPGGIGGAAGGHSSPPPRGPVRVDWTITAPDGSVHRPRSQADPNVLISADLLERSRDLAGFSSQPWTLTLTAPEGLAELTEATCAAQIDPIAEANASAPPLVSTTTTIDAHGTASFDLTINATGDVFFDLGARTDVTTALIDPAGAVVATATGTFRHTVSGRDLIRVGRSGWRFTITNDTPGALSIVVLVRVVAQARIPAAVVNERFRALMQGDLPDGDSFSVDIDHDAAHAPTANVVSLRIDKDLFFTLDAFGFLDDLEDANLSAARVVDPQATRIDIDPGQRAPISRVADDRVSITNLQFGAITATFGGNGPNAALLTLAMPITAIATDRPTQLVIHDTVDVTLDVAPCTVTAELYVSASELSGIATQWFVDLGGLQLDPAGAGSTTATTGEITGTSVDDVKEQLRAALVSGLTALSTTRLPAVLTTLLGGQFTFLSAGWDGDVFVFEYVAPLDPPEHEVSPRYSARGTVAAGSSVSFAAPNLEKIAHIVVLMMENRSFDHMLGHLSLTGGRTDVDGLSQAYLDSYGTGGRPAPALATRLPFDPDHSFEGTALQIGGGLGHDGPMRGFMLSFLNKYPFLAFPADSPQRAAQDDPFWLELRKPYDATAILGYHTADTAPVYAALASQYMLCDRWFASHPGPTFPNRFFYLGGQLGRDSSGEPQRNNGADSLRLLRSRTIQDALTDHGVTWTMYESNPDVCMLRMYAKYAFDDTVIRPIDEFYAAAAAGELPSVTFLEPQYHLGEGTSDDHPPSDIARGQAFVAGVYNALTANPEAWERTLFVLTYDEHGGIADHVLPPLADRYQPDGAPPIDVSYGVRVPALVVSPWVPAASTTRSVTGAADVVFDHTSILKTIANRFMPDTRALLSDRMAFANDLFPLLTETAPRPAVPIPVPSVPSVPAAASASASRRALIDDATAMAAPLPRGRSLFGASGDFHDYMSRLALLVT